MYEDVFSIVDSTFMPCGVECDQYSVIGEIHELSKERNSYTGENIYIMNLECNDVEFTLGINEKHLLGGTYGRQTFQRADMASGKC